MSENNKSKKVEKPENDAITRMAIDEILRETVRGSVRAEKMGPSGWQPCPLRKLNKRFLNTTIKSVISHNKRTTQKPKTFDKTTEKTDKSAKFGPTKHKFKKPEKKSS